MAVWDGGPDLVGAVGRVLATAQNGLEVLRFGGLETGTEPAPFAVVETHKMFRLRRYFPNDPSTGPNIVLVPPMMVSANVSATSPSTTVRCRFCTATASRRGSSTSGHPTPKKAGWNAISPTTWSRSATRST